MPSPDDLVFGASVEDKTSIFFDRFEQRVKGIEKTAQTGFANIDKTIQSSGKGFAVLAGAVGGVTSMIAMKLAQAVLDAAASVRQFLGDAAQLTARVDTLGIVLNIVGENAGYSKEQLAEFEEKLKATGITTQAARQSLAQMAQAELDLSKASELARVAQDAAVIAGINSSDAFQRILHGIQTVQPEILRTMGLYINMNQELDRYAKQHDKTAEQISITERQQVALNAVMKAGEKIAGSYEAAMGTVGKQITSLPRYYEELQLAAGRAFQPALGVLIAEKTELLKDLATWLNENRDQIEEFGERAADVLTYVLDLLQKLIDLASKLPGWIEQAGIATAKQLDAILQLNVDIEENAEHLKEYFGQAVSLLWGLVKAAGAGIMNLIDAVILGWRASIATMKLQFEEADNLRVQAAVKLLETGTIMKDAFTEGTVAAAEFFGVIEGGKGKVEAETDEMRAARIAAEELAAALGDATLEFDKFIEKMEEDAAERAIKETREAIERALREAWYLEDIARQHAERIAQIEKQLQESLRDAAEGYADARVDIERNYRRQIQAIQRQFLYDAEEYARSRDAIGLLRAMRQRDIELKETKINRNDNLEDARISYERQLRDLREAKAEQLQALKEAEERETEARALALKRQEELDELHRQWEEEDRARAYGKQLKDLYNQLSSMKGMNADALKNLLMQYEAYFSALIPYVLEEQTKVSEIMSSSDTAPPQYSSGSVNVPSVLQRRTGTNITRNAPPVMGQMGQVSQLLANPTMLLNFMMPSLPQIPFSGGDRRTHDTRDLRVHVDGNALEPYIQRIVATAILEIERNRG